MFPVRCVQFHDTTWFGRKLIVHDAGLGVTIAPDPRQHRDEFPSHLLVSGLDRNQRSWLLSVPFYGMGTSVWAADFDANGIQDIAILGIAGGNTIAPCNVLHLVLFDSVGRPHHRMFEGYFDAIGGGVECIRDLDADGRAELFSHLMARDMPRRLSQGCIASNVATHVSFSVVWQDINSRKHRTTQLIRVLIRSAARPLRLTTGCRLRGPFGAAPPNSRRDRLSDSD